MALCACQSNIICPDTYKNINTHRHAQETRKDKIQKE